MTTPAAAPNAGESADEVPACRPPAGLTPLAIALLTDFRPWAFDLVHTAEDKYRAALQVLYRVEDLATRHLMHEPPTGTDAGARPALSVVPH
jgi:hypothetical protein